MFINEHLTHWNQEDCQLTTMLSNGDTCFKDGTFLIGFIPSIFCSIIVVIITVKSIQQLAQTNISKTIKSLYYISCISGIITIITCCMDSFLSCLYINHSNIALITSLIRIAMYFVITAAVLGTLLVRVYSTFKESVFEISKYHKMILIILYILILTSASIVCIIGAGKRTSDLIGTERTIHTIFTDITAILYVVIFIYALILFSNKMFKMLNENGNKTKKQFDAQLLHAALKYVSLLSLAIFTTLITAVLVVIYIQINKWWIIMRQIIIMQYAVDCAINVICLYLQYPFATKYYDEYCGCLTKCWSIIFRRELTQKCITDGDHGTNNNKIEDYVHVAEQTPVNVDLDKSCNDNDNKSANLEDVVPINVYKNTSTAL